MTIDWNLGVGSIGEIIAIIGAAISIYTTTQVSFGKLHTRVDSMQKELERLANVTETQARFDERLIALEKRWDELRHGKGYVRD